MNSSLTWRESLAFLDDPTQGYDNIITDKVLAARLLLALRCTGNAGGTRHEGEEGEPLRVPWLPTYDKDTAHALYDGASKALKALAPHVHDISGNDGEYTFDAPALGRLTLCNLIAEINELANDFLETEEDGTQWLEVAVSSGSKCPQVGCVYVTWDGGAGRGWRGAVNVTPAPFEGYSPSTEARYVAQRFITAGMRYATVEAMALGIVEELNEQRQIDLTGGVK